MSEPKFNSKEEFEKAVIEKCWKDEEFLNKLKSNPVETISSEFDLELVNVEVKVLELEPNEIVITIPPKPSTDEEISEKELDMIAGGTSLIYDTYGPRCWTLHTAKVSGAVCVCF